MTTYYDVEYVDDNGVTRKSRMQSINGVHGVDQMREWIAARHTFGEKAVIKSLTRLTDSAESAAAAASRPELPPAIVKQMQNAENAANPPAAGQPAAEAFPPAPAQA
jgi:hypothetical protein